MAAIEDGLVARLHNLGFSPYEAKAYLALLRHSPVSGYELSRNAGVPSAKIYETLDRLRGRGALVVIAGEPQRYAPIAPTELLASMRSSFEASCAGLAEALEEQNGEPETDYIFHLQGYEPAMAKARALVQAAVGEIAIFAWASECRLLAADLEKAMPRIRVMGVVCGSFDGLPQLQRHGFEQAVLEEQGGKLFVLVRDEEEAMLGGIADGCGLALTRNPGLVRVGLEYVKHELYQAKIMQHYGRRFVEDFGEQLETLRPAPKGGRGRPR